MISICNVTRNRSVNLEKCWRTWLFADEIIIMDYGSDIPIKIDHPKVKVYRYESNTFSKTKGLNMAIGLVKGDIIIQADSDYYFNRIFRESDLYCNEFIDGHESIEHLEGFLMCRRSDLLKVNGYNERLIYYAHEDTDLCERLVQIGLNRKKINPNDITHIPHSDVERLKEFGVKCRGNDIKRMLHKSRCKNIQISIDSPWTIKDKMSIYEEHMRVAIKKDTRSCRRNDKIYYNDEESDYSTLSEVKPKNRVLWGITTYFNPKNYANKFRNYHKFRNNCHKQGLNLITVECVFGDHQFSLSKNDADILIQVRSDSVLWQKERLLNIGLDNLPSECEYVAWLDADIIFLNNDWVNDSIAQLEKHNVIQLFKTAVRLEENQKFTKESDFVVGKDNNSKNLSYAHCSQNNIVLDGFPESGLGWAIRKDIILKTRFFDQLILGGGDHVMCESFLNSEDTHISKYCCGISSEIEQWRKGVVELVNGDVSYLQGTIIHLYHGDMKNRFYSKRYENIKPYNFSLKDIKLNRYGCWEWDTDKTGLIKYVEDYFALRREDINILNGYYDNRRHLKYYEEVISYINSCSGNIIVDVGAADTDIILNGDFANRIIVDKIIPKNKLDGVNYINCDYLDSDIQFADLVLCLQVIEHVDNPKKFAQKLLSQGKTVVVSVPYNWDKEFCKSHLHDTIDDEKMHDWFLIEPVFSKIITENDNTTRKIYQYKGKK